MSDATLAENIFMKTSTPWRRVSGIGGVLSLAGAAASLAGPAPAAPSVARPPNVVLIYADDLGYGDISAYGAHRVATPHIDRLAKEGLRFTSAYAAAATCTPSRYALLTGEYAWRRKGTDVLSGDAKLIIQPGRTTLPVVFQRAGYATAAIGKWHLGLGDDPTDWNQLIRPGPKEIGFDYSFIMPATGDRVPCVYVENGKVVDLDPSDPIAVNYARKVGNDPTGKENPDQLRMGLTHGHDGTIVNGISRIGFMSGGKRARWTDEDMADRLAREAIGFIERNRERPFFVYLATHDIHVPRVPNARFEGKSGLGPRGDVILQLDDTVGQVMDALQRLGLDEKTMIIFTSDNGPVLDDGYADDAVTKLNGHAPAGPLRGGKYSIYEGGTRVPFIVRWPGRAQRVQPGVSDAVFSQVDLLRSFAAITGQVLKKEDAPDSWNLWNTLIGGDPKGREWVVEQANVLAVRSGPWKYIPGAPSHKDADQLFNVLDDMGETQNLAKKQPRVVETLSGILRSSRRGTASPVDASK